MAPSTQQVQGEGQPDDDDSGNNTGLYQELTLKVSIIETSLKSSNVSLALMFCADLLTIRASS